MKKYIFMAAMLCSTAVFAAESTTGQTGYDTTGAATSALAAADTITFADGTNWYSLAYTSAAGGLTYTSAR